MKRIVLAPLLFYLLLIISCNGTITNPNSSTLIDRIPVFSSSSVIKSGARSVMPDDMSMDDFVYATLAPPITKFENNSNPANVGDSIVVNIFSNEVTLDSSITDDKMIKLAGVIIEKDEKGEELETGKIEIIYDKENSKFSYYSEILVVYDAGGSFVSVYVIQEIPFTKIDDSNSFLAEFKTLTYMKHSLESVDIQLVENGELYSGYHTENDWIVGFAFSSFKSLQSKDDPILNINSNDQGILVNDEGILKDALLFKSIRKQIVEVKDALFEEEGTPGNPVIGYRNIDSDSSYHTRVFINTLPVDGEATKVYLSTYGAETLKNSGKEEIKFDFYILENSEPIISLTGENTNLLKSGIPNADWRSRTTL